MFQYVHQLHRPQQMLAKNSFTVYNEPLSALLYLDPIKGFIMKAHLMFHNFKRVFNISTNFRWFQSRRMNLSSPAAWPVQIKKKTKRGKNDPKSMLLLPKSKFKSMNYIFPIFIALNSFWERNDKLLILNIVNQHLDISRCVQNTNCNSFQIQR